MGDACCSGGCGASDTGIDERFRRVLWIALVLNAGMFAIEIVGGIMAQSVSLQADAMDFLGDAVNYGISLFALGLGMAARARAALIKGVSMGMYGLAVIGSGAQNLLAGTVPEPVTMGWVGLLALAVNVGVAAALYRHREGDANMRSVWLCSRNDAIGNAAVLLAASGVFATGTGWPDLAVAAVMAALALSAAWQVIGRARGELREARTQVAA